MTLRLAWLDTTDERDVPFVLSDPEPVSIPTHQPDENGNYGRVEYMAVKILRRATKAEVDAWREAHGT